MSLIGSYYLKGQREMASGFLLKPGNEFEFFFTYGALDRFARGVWKEENEEVVFNSAPAPGNNFSLISSANSSLGHIEISMQGGNPQLFPYIYISLEEGKEGSWKPLNSHGQLGLPPQQLNSITLLFEFCPDRICTIPVDETHDEFVFRIEPWMFEIFINDLRLKADGTRLLGKHPLIQGDVEYEKDAEGSR